MRRMRFMSHKSNLIKSSSDPLAEKTLCDVANGQCVLVSRLSGEASFCERLREMGFCESAKVVKLTENGALICRVCESRVVLSEGLARSIIVRACEN
jgi:ferrous iron transport protein A